MTEKKIDLDFVSKQLADLGWEILSGSAGKPGAEWRHDLIDRKFSVYEAAFCHNLLVAITEIGKEDKNFLNIKMSLRLLADGWSLDTEKLESGDIGLFIYDRVAWWKQIHNGGKRHWFKDAEPSVRDNADLDNFFLKYLSRMGRITIYPLSDSGEIQFSNSETDEREQVGIRDLLENKEVQRRVNLKKMFVVEGVDDATLQRAVVVLLDRKKKDDLIELRKKTRALFVASREANEALDRVLSTAGVPLDEETD